MNSKNGLNNGVWSRGEDKLLQRVEEYSYK